MLAASRLVCVALTMTALLIGQPPRVHAAGELVPAPPAVRSTAAVGERAVEVTRAVLDARALALHRYFYVDFPRALAAVQQEAQLVEAELALVDRRLETFRPVRSFGRYGATYTADAAAQLDRRVLEHRLACLREHEADLWRERQLAALQLTAAAGR